MKRSLLTLGFLASACLFGSAAASAGQAPGAASDPDIPISHRDRVYAAEQFSNTVSVTDPVDNKLVGVIRLGDPQPGNFSPLYKGQVLVHGMGFSPDHKTIAVVSIGSNSVTFIDTATNAVKHTTYVGRSPHEAFFTPDGKEVWVTVRGEDYVAVLDGRPSRKRPRIKVPAGPGMQIFSPDGKYGYVCSSFNPETVVITVADHQIVGHVKQDSPFCPNIAATPDGKQVWFTLKDVGKTMVFDAQPPFDRAEIDRYRTDHQSRQFRAQRQRHLCLRDGRWTERGQGISHRRLLAVATIPVGKLPHGMWPSGDGSRVYVGLENADGMAAIDTVTNKLIATSPIGQAPQAITYVPNAVPEGDGTQGLQPLGVAGRATHLTLGAAEGRKPAGDDNAPDQRFPVRPGIDPGAAGLSDGAGAQTAIRIGPDERGGR